MASKQTENTKTFSVRRGSSTVKVYATPRSGRSLWTLAYYAPDGRRIRKTFAERADAQRAAETAAALLSTGQSDALSLTGGDRSQLLRAIEVIQPFNISLSVACEDYAAARAKLPGGVSLLHAVEFYAARHVATSTKTVKQLCEEMLADLRANGCTKTHEQSLASRLTHFAKAFVCPLADVQPNWVREYLRNLTGQKGQSISNRTRSNFRMSIVSLFNWAQRRRYITRELATEIAEIEAPKYEPSPTGIFTPEEFTKLINAASDDMKAVLAIGAFAGLRAAELQRLDWSEVKLSEGVIIVSAEKSKTAARRVVPIMENLIKWLSPFVRGQGRVSPGATIHSFCGRCRYVSRAAGVPWVRNGLRHSFCSYRLALTHDPARVANEAGNSPAMIHRHYKALTTEAIAKRWFAIEPEARPNVVEMTAG